MARRPWLSARTRSAIIAAAGSRCAACRELRPAEQLEIDHELPLAEGGSHALANLRPLCRECHAIKSGLERARHRSRRDGRSWR